MGLGPRLSNPEARAVARVPSRPSGSPAAAAGSLSSGIAAAACAADGPTAASMVSPAPASSSPGDLPWRARSPTRGDGAPAPPRPPRQRRRGMAVPSGGTQTAPRCYRARRMGGCYTIGGSRRAVALLLGKAQRQRRLAPTPPSSGALLPALPRPVTSCLRLQSAEMYSVSVRCDRQSLSCCLSLAGRSTQQD